MKHTLWNLIACLKNGAVSKKTTILHTKKKISENLLTLLWEEGYILGYCINKKEKNNLKIFLKYNSKKESSIKKITSVSKPGKRIYCSAKNLWKFNSHNKLIILSTNKGLQSLTNCQKNKLGGEIILTVL